MQNVQTALLLRVLQQLVYLCQGANYIMHNFPHSTTPSLQFVGLCATGCYRNSFRNQLLIHIYLHYATSWHACPHIQSNIPSSPTGISFWPSFLSSPEYLREWRHLWNPSRLFHHGDVARWLSSHLKSLTRFFDLMESSRGAVGGPNWGKKGGPGCHSTTMCNWNMCCSKHFHHSAVNK